MEVPSLAPKQQIELKRKQHLGWSYDVECDPRYLHIPHDDHQMDQPKTYKPVPSSNNSLHLSGKGVNALCIHNMAQIQLYAMCFQMAHNLFPLMNNYYVNDSGIHI